MDDIIENLIANCNTLAIYSEFIKPRGILIASIPNIQHWRTVFNLLNGKWEYREWGTLDKTHLRFFTKSSIRNLFTQSGFKISKIAYENSLKSKILNLMTLGAFRNFGPFKFLILAYKE